MANGRCLAASAFERLSFLAVFMTTCYRSEIDRHFTHGRPTQYLMLLQRTSSSSNDEQKESKGFESKSRTAHGNVSGVVSNTEGMIVEDEHNDRHAYCIILGLQRWRGWVDMQKSAIG